MSDLDAVAAAIRPATAADAPGIRAIRNAAIRDSLAIWTSREQTEAEALAWLTPQITRGTALVAERVDGEILGFAVASAWQAYEGYARTSARASSSSALSRPPARSTDGSSTSCSCRAVCERHSTSHRILRQERRRRTRAAHSERVAEMHQSHALDASISI